MHNMLKCVPSSTTVSIITTIQEPPETIHVGKLDTTCKHM